MVLFAMLAGILIGAAVTSLVAFGWAASRLRWLGAHCHRQIAYWRDEANRAMATAAWLRDSPRPNDPGPWTGNGDGA